MSKDIVENYQPVLPCGIFGATKLQDVTTDYYNSHRHNPTIYLRTNDEPWCTNSTRECIEMEYKRNANYYSPRHKIDGRTSPDKRYRRQRGVCRRNENRTKTEFQTVQNDNMDMEKLWSSPTTLSFVSNALEWANFLTYGHMQILNNIHITNILYITLYATCTVGWTAVAGQTLLDHLPDICTDWKS